MGHRHVVFLTALCGAAVLWAAVWSVGGAVPPPPRLVVLFIDSQGHQNLPLAKEWEDVKPGVEAPAGVVLADSPWAPSVTAALTEEERTSLLTWPALALASSRGAAHWNGAWILLVPVDEKGRPAPFQPELVQTATGDTFLLPSLTGKSVAEAVKHTLPAAAAIMIPGPANAVVGNRASRLYHLPGAGHLPLHMDPVPFPDAQAAAAAGYRPCPVCFPEANPNAHRDATEVALSNEVSGSIEYSYRVLRDPAVTARVAAVGQQLVERNHLTLFSYRFTVLDTDDMNAFSAGAGSTYITRGLLQILESDGELASVLAHEIGHTEAHHLVRAYYAATSMQWLSVLAGVVTGTSWASFATDFIANVINRGYDRRFELEADRLGVIYTETAGYDAREFVTVLRKLQELGKQEGGGGPQWLRTHPSEDRRIEQSGTILTQLQELETKCQGLQEADPGMAAFARVHEILFLDSGDTLDHITAIAKKLPPSTPASAPETEQTAAPQTPLPGPTGP